MTQTGPLYTTLRFIGRHVRGFRAAIALFILLCLATATLLVLGLAFLSASIDTGFTEAVDARALQWIAGHRVGWLDDVMRHLTRLGDGIVVVTLGLACSAFLWLMGRRWSVFLLLAGVIGGQIANNLIKLAFARPRPNIVDAATEVRTMSFPSGHAMAAVLAYGTIAYLLSRLEPTPGLRRATWTFATIFIVGIGASRMYLGVHYPTDILGGFIFGIAWLVLVATMIKAIRFYTPKHRTPGADLPPDRPR